MSKKKGLALPLGILAGVILLLVIIGFIVYQTVFNTPKNNYLMAEMTEMDNTYGLIEERFENEIAWYEHSRENAIESTLNLTAETNSPDFQEMGIDQLINDSNIDITTGQDMSAEVMTMGLDATVAGMELKDVDTYLTGETLGLTLPFINDYLVVNEQDAASLLSKIDPDTFDGSEEIDYSMFFQNEMFTEEQREYFKEEYSQFIRESLPDEAFESESEEVTVGESTINADKLTMTLSEEELQTFLSDLLNKMAEDEEISKVVETQALSSSFISPESEDVEDLVTDFNDSLKEAAENVQSTEFPDGLTSVVWKDGDHIVQRDLDTSIVTDGMTETIAIDGTNEITDENQNINYDFTFGGDGEDLTLNLAADLSETENGYEDVISIGENSNEALVIDSEKSTEDSNEVWNANIDFKEYTFGSNFSLFVESSSAYEDDQATGDFTFYADDGQSINQDTFALHLNHDSQTVNEIEVPQPDNVQNLGEMSKEELETYFNEDIAEEFENWMMENTGSMQP